MTTKQNKQFTIPIIEETIDWDNLIYEPEKRRGELASDINKFSKLIESTALTCQQNVPKSYKETIALLSPIGRTNLTIEGRGRLYSDTYLWYTRTTYKPIVKVLRSAVNLKPLLEKTLGSPLEARDFFRYLVDSFRYVEPPVKSITEDYKTSGIDVLMGSKLVVAVQTKNAFTRGFVFAGSDAVDGYKDRIAKILNALKPKQVLSSRAHTNPAEEVTNIDKATEEEKAAYELWRDKKNPQKTVAITLNKMPEFKNSPHYPFTQWKVSRLVNRYRQRHNTSH